MATPNYMAAQRGNWAFSQWNTTSDFPALSYIASTNEWTIGNGMSAVHWYPPSAGQAATIAVAQNGQYLPCANGEFDVLFGPNGWAAANNPTQYPAQAIKDSPTLNLLTHIQSSGTYTLNDVRSGGNSPYQCDINQASSGVGVVLLNKQTNPYQFFFYNLHFTNFCVDGGTANSQYTSCQQAVAAQQPGWFWTGASGPRAHVVDSHPQWGIDDLLNQYGGSNITDHNSRGLALDLLPRLTRLIITNPYNMDPNPSHWEVTSYSMGQADWGNVYMQTTFKDFILIYSCGSNAQGCPN